MKHEQAYIKLASLRLAINYVLRNRSMTKSASGWTNPLIGAGLGAGLGYLLSPEKHKLLGTLGGGLLGGAAGYGFDQWITPNNKQDAPEEVDINKQDILDDSTKDIPTDSIKDDEHTSPESYDWLRRLDDASSREWWLYPDGSFRGYPLHELSMGTQRPWGLALDLERGYTNTEELSKSMPEYAEIYNNQFKPETTPGWADKPKEEPESAPVSHTDIPAVDPNLPPEMSTTWADTSDPSKFNRQSQLALGREVDEEGLNDQKWNKPVDRNEWNPSADWLFTNYNEDYRPVNEMRNMWGALNRGSISDALEHANDYSKEDYLPVYNGLHLNPFYSEFNTTLPSDFPEFLKDTSKEQSNNTLAPFVPTDEDYQRYQQELAKEESNKTEEPTSMSNKYQKILDEWMAEGNEPPQEEIKQDTPKQEEPSKPSFTPSTLEDVVNKNEDSSDKDYEGIKPEYHWLVNLEKVLDEAAARNRASFEPELKYILGSTAILRKDDSGDEYTTPSMLAKSLSLEPGDPNKMSEEDERSYLRNLVSLYDNYYNDVSYFPNAIALPAYPVSATELSVQKNTEREKSRRKLELKQFIQWQKEDAEFWLTRLKKSNTKGDPFGIKQLGYALRWIREAENALDALEGRKLRHPDDGVQ